jgi:hypothetical protein
MTEENINEKTEFMRRSRFETIRNKFQEISPTANEVIASARQEDILRLSMTFNSPVKVLDAEVFDEKKFLELAF